MSGVRFRDTIRRVHKDFHRPAQREQQRRAWDLGSAETLALHDLMIGHAGVASKQIGFSLPVQ